MFKMNENGSELFQDFEKFSNFEILTKIIQLQSSLYFQRIFQSTFTLLDPNLTYIKVNKNDFKILQNLGNSQIIIMISSEFRQC